MVRDEKVSLHGASLLAPNFKISVNGSSCKYLLFCLILAPLLSLSVYWQDGMPRKRIAYWSTTPINFNNL